MLPTLTRRMASGPFAAKVRDATRQAVTGMYQHSAYKPKKIWPPDFSKLSPKDQFRLEKRYKRRVKLATARPRWDKFVRLAQLGSVTFVLIYSVLFMDWNTEKQPFEGIRSVFWGGLEAFSSEKRDERQQPDIPTTSSRK